MIHSELQGGRQLLPNTQVLLKFRSKRKENLSGIEIADYYKQHLVNILEHSNFGEKLSFLRFNELKHELVIYINNQA